MIVLRLDLSSVIGARQPFALPEGARPLSVQMIREVPRLWVAVPDQRLPTNTMAVMLVLTGGPAPNDASYIGTCVSREGDEMHVWKL